MRLLKIKGGYGESRQKEQNRAFPCCRQIKVGIVWWDTGSETTGAIRRLGSSWSCVIMSAISCEKKKSETLLKDQACEPHTLMTAAASVSASCLMHQKATQKWEAALNEQQTAVWHCLPWSYIWKWRSLDCMSAGWSECPLLSSGLKIAQATGLKGQFPVVIASGFSILSRPSYHKLLLFCLAKPLETLGLFYLPSSWWHCPVFPSCSNPKVANKCLFLSSPKQPLQTYPPHRIVYWWFFSCKYHEICLVSKRTHQVRFFSQQPLFSALIWWSCGVCQVTLPGNVLPLPEKRSFRAPVSVFQKKTANICVSHILHILTFLHIFVPPIIKTKAAIWCLSVIHVTLPALLGYGIQQLGCHLQILEFL